MVEVGEGVSRVVVGDQVCALLSGGGYAEEVVVPAGQVLKIVATDPGSVKDFEAFCKQTGNELLSSSEAGGAFEFMIKKS